VRQLFTLAYEKEISTKDSEDIMEATAGWIAGINLVAENDQPSKWALADFQSHEYWFDYLAIEVLEQQPQKLQEFLLNTCILTFLEPELCSEVAQVKNSVPLLNQLLDRNLFLSSVSKGLPVYKLHQLFRDFLIQRLCRDDPGRLQELYGRAGLAMEKHHRIPEAIQFYMEAGQQEEFLSILKREHESLLERGYFQELGYWIGTLPSSTLENHPDLLLCNAQVAIQLGDKKRFRSNS